MQQPESKLIEKTRAVLERKPYSWLYEKLHGGIFQSGLPDTLWTLPDGRQIWIEFKMGDHWKVELLKGRQRLVCLRWAMRGVPVYVLGEANPARGWLVDLRQYAKNSAYEGFACGGEGWLRGLVDCI